MYATLPETDNREGERKRQREDVLTKKKRKENEPSVNNKREELSQNWPCKQIHERVSHIFTKK